MYLDDTSKELAEKVLGMVKEGAVEIYSKVQQVAPELWKLVVRQVYINGIECFIASGIFLIMFVLGVFSFKHAMKDSVSSHEAEPFAVLGVIGIILGAILFTVFFVDGLDLTLNPSYWALKDIMDLLQHH